MLDKKEYKRRYRQANKEKIKEKQRQIYLAEKHEPTLYIIEDLNYVGVTENLSRRIRNHKSKNKRSVDSLRVLAKFKTRSEALEVERLIHDLGYSGKHTKNSYK